MLLRKTWLTLPLQIRISSPYLTYTVIHTHTHTHTLTHALNQKIATLISLKYLSCLVSDDALIFLLLGTGKLNKILEKLFNQALGNGRHG
ncbi:MAG: hypothetical protein JL57_08090 [Desulfosporosinus sp. BICA1-9]|nr:MAG: hypothetical protein JL57_08090 [Desulfosporosinus sp. BICA1-9]